MPRMDGTGPCGVGPVTGGGVGRCGAGRSFARHGLCHHADLNETSEKALAAEVALLRRQTAAVTERLDALSARLNSEE